MTWLLYAVGLVLSVLLVMMGIPPLAFAIGMYLPLQINTPLFLGGLISHFVEKSAADKKASEARVQRGTLIASGFIAGGAIMGVVGALLTLMKLNPYIELGLADKHATLAQVISIALYAGLGLYLYLDSRRAKA